MSELTRILDRIRDALPEYGEPIIAVLEIAQAATGLGGTAAAQGLRMLEAALKALEQGSHDPVEHAAILAKVAELHDQTSADRAREDAELAALTPPSGTPESAG
jgi:hypothetical protein